MSYFSFKLSLACKVLITGLSLLLSFPVLAKPQRIVSINLCTDQLLMLIAERKHIASVSYLAAKKNSSAMYLEAKGIKANHGRAEDILLMKPDLILAGTYTSRPAVFLLNRLGFNIIELPVARNLDDIRQNIKTIANAVGEVEKGEQLLAAFNQRLAQVLAARPKQRPIAVFYRENGYTTGSNTLANTLLETAGFINLATQLGISGSGYLSLETLIAEDPRIIISGKQRSQNGSIARAAFQHPAFKKFITQKQIINISDPLWICGTPFVLDAIENLITMYQQTPHEKN